MRGLRLARPATHVNAPAPHPALFAPVPPRCYAALMLRSWLRRLGPRLVVTLLLALLASRGDASSGIHLRIFYSTDLKGAVEPCG